MTLNARNTLLQKNNVLRSPLEKKLNEYRRILSAAKCKPVIIVSRNIKYLRILAGVRGGGSKFVTTSQASLEYGPTYPVTPLSQCMLLYSLRLRFLKN